MGVFLSFLGAVWAKIPKSAKPFFAIGVATFLAVLVFQFRGFIPYLSNSGDTLVEVQIIVQNANNQSLENVEIQVISQGAPITLYTNTSGYARVEIPTRRDVDVILTKDGYKSKKETINLSTDPNRNRIFRLTEGNGDSSRGLIYQHYTAQNEFFPITLSMINPDLDIPLIKSVFKNSLGVEMPPFVDLNNPVREAINIFKEETGNRDLEDFYLTENNASGFRYTVRDSSHSRTTEGLITDQIGTEIQVTNKSEALETEQSFEERSKYLPSGEEAIFGSFYFSPILSEIQLDSEVGEYTSSISTGESLLAYNDDASSEEDSGISGFLIQYPRLGDLESRMITDSSKTIYDTLSKDLWIREVIKRNPDHRGFLAFSYPYARSYINYFRGLCGFSVPDVIRYTPSPYVKFIDFKNALKKVVKVTSMTYRILDKKSHDLTVADKRSQLLRDAPIQSRNINITLEPGQHFFVPIEFGFNTKPQKSRIKNIIEIDSEVDHHISKSLLIRKASHLSKKDYEMLQSDNFSSKEETSLLMEKLHLEKEFMNSMPSLDVLLKKIPERIAVGSIINIESIEIDDSSHLVDPPNDSPTVYISKYLQAGC